MILVLHELLKQKQYVLICAFRSEFESFETLQALARIGNIPAAASRLQIGPYFALYPA